jgi:hypothetical protein
MVLSLITGEMVEIETDPIECATWEGLARHTPLNFIGDDHDVQTRVRFVTCVDGQPKEAEWPLSSSE